MTIVQPDFLSLRHFGHLSIIILKLP